MRKWLLIPLVVLLALVIVGSAVAAPLSRDRAAARTAAKALQNDRTPLRGAPEILLRPYTQYTYYTELAGILSNIAKRAPNRVQVIRQTNSANGNPLYLVVITKKMTRQQKQINSNYRKMLLSDPGYILSHNWLKSGSDIRPAVFINGSIHGGETTGMDASLKLIRRLAFQNDATTKKVLNNLVVVVNPCQNPDGRFTDSRPNGNGFDMNRDFIELSQAETQQTVKNIAKWVPLSFDDLHGYVNPILIEPTTFPHNPSLEYDLLVKNTLHQARAQVKANAENTGFDSQIPYLWGTAEDKFGNANEGWDDYGPYYTPQITQYYGAMGQTVETPYKTNDGVAQHYWVSWTSVQNCLDHKWQLAKDQATMLKRGDKNIVSGRAWASNMTDMIRSADPATGDVADVGWFLPDGVTKNPAFPYSNLVGDLTFPYAYVIPVARSMQQNPSAAVKFVNRARLYGAEVTSAKAAFDYNSVTYPAGTYVVMTAQPLRPLVNNLLWDGEDVRAQYGVSSMYDVSVWSLPYMWRFDRTKADTAFTASLKRVTTTQTITGSVTGPGPIYSFAGDNNPAIKTANEMLVRGFTAGMVTKTLAAPNDGIALGSFIVDATEPQVQAYLKMAAANNGIDFTTVTGVAMTDTSVINHGASRPSVRINVDAQALWALKTVMGFDNISSTSTPGGNVFINSSSSVTAATVQTWLNGDSYQTNGQRRTYVGVAKGGTSQTALFNLPVVTISSISVANPTVITTSTPHGLTTGQTVTIAGSNSTPTVNGSRVVTVIDATSFSVPVAATVAGTAGTVQGSTTLPAQGFDPDPLRGDNGFCPVAYTAGDIQTAGYKSTGFVFTYPAAWFDVGTVTNADVKVDATYTASTAGIYQSGFWNDPANTTAGVDKAAMVTYEPTGLTAHGRVVFMGFHPLYRAQPEGNYLLVARAILLSAATPPTTP